MVLIGLIEKCMDNELLWFPNSDVGNLIKKNLCCVFFKNNVQVLISVIRSNRYMSMVMLELFYSNVKLFHVCISKFNFPVTNELFVYQTRLISDFCTSLCSTVGNSHVTFFAFIDVLQFKEVIACKNIDYVQRILLLRYFNGFFNI